MYIYTFSNISRTCIYLLVALSSSNFSSSYLYGYILLGCARAYAPLVTYRVFVYTY